MQLDRLIFIGNAEKLAAVPDARTALLECDDAESVNGGWTEGITGAQPSPSHSPGSY